MCCLATKNFMIEELCLIGFASLQNLTGLFLRPNEATTLNINAVNFFGPPAANRNYETEIQIRQKGFSAKGFNDYDFSFD